MVWWLVTVPLASGDDPEVWSARLWSAGATGVAETAAGPDELAPTDAGARAATRSGDATVAGDDGVVLSAGFVDEATAVRAVAGLGHPAARAAPVDPDAWVEEWRRTAAPTRVTGLVVRAPWHPPDPDPAAVTEVVIDPGPTFGHGGHPTTRLVLAELAGLVRPGASVLDVGCGSGVLAVAAAALGAGRVVAVDTDPAAVAATGDNARANGVEVDARVGTVGAGLGRFDLVLANLLAPVLRDLGPALAAATGADGGQLVVTGLLAEQQAEVQRALRPLQARTARRDGDWVLLTLTHPVPWS